MRWTALVKVNSKDGPLLRLSPLPLPSASSILIHQQLRVVVEQEMVGPNGSLNRYNKTQNLANVPD